MLVKFWKLSVKVVVMASLYEKWKRSWENQLRHSAEKSRPMYLLHASIETVPISVWRGGGMHSSVCHIVTSFTRLTVSARTWTWSLCQSQSAARRNRSQLFFWNVSAKTPWTTTTTPQPFHGLSAGPPGWAGARRKTSGLYGATEDQQRQTHRPSGWAPLHPD